MERALRRYCNYIGNPSSPHITELGSVVLAKYITTNYGVKTDLDRVGIYRYRVREVMRELHRSMRENSGSPERDDSLATQFNSVVTELRQEAIEWPLNHDSFVRLANNFVRPSVGSTNMFALEVLPSCIYSDKSDNRWKNLQDRPEWDPLYKEIRAKLQREDDTNGRIIAFALMLIILALSIHWALLIVALPLAIILAVLISHADGPVPKDRFGKLGRMLLDACARDKQLYRQFVETGIFRLRVVTYGK
jgi:hypothetical protein